MVYSFRGWAIIVEESGSRQADVALETELRSFIPNQQVGGRENETGLCLKSWNLNVSDTPPERPHQILPKTVPRARDQASKSSYGNHFHSHSNRHKPHPIWADYASRIFYHCLEQSVKNERISSNWWIVCVYFLTAVIRRKPLNLSLCRIPSPIVDSQKLDTEEIPFFWT